MYYVYRFIDKNNNILYVGKSKQNLEHRFRGHFHLPKECYDLVYKIEYIECLTESDMSIKEIYYINKYHNNYMFFNILDTTEPSASLEFNDIWKLYSGPLPIHFTNSINYTEGYTFEKIVRYNKDGTIDKRKTNKIKGETSFVEGFTKEEVNLIIDYLAKSINEAENHHQEQLRFRNLLMFILGVNLPLKTTDFLRLKYNDLFDENDCPKAVKFDLGRFRQDETIYIPLKEIVVDVLVSYATKYGLTYSQNANEELFRSRKHQTVSLISWGRILKSVALAVGIDKNIGAESLRKTFGLNVYTISDNKLNALLFLGEIWGQVREARIINYLGLSKEEANFDYYLSEHFSLGNVDLSKIKCLKINSIPVFNIYKRKEHSQKSKHSSIKETVTIDNYKKAKSQKKNRVWTKEQKLEIIEEHLVKNIQQKLVAEKYSIDAGLISRWISAYKQYGIDGLEDKRYKK